MSLDFKIRICKANALESHGVAISQNIAITEKIPDGMTLRENDLFFEHQAGMINRALFETLPQGTYDRLGIMFMQHKTSLHYSEQLTVDAARGEIEDITKNDVRR